MRPIHIAAIAGLSVAMFGAAQAELEGSVHVGINTEYIWRGVDTTQVLGGGNESMMEAGLDLSLGTIAGWDVGVGMWYASVHGGGSFDEIDYFANASRSFGCVTAHLGYIYYDFPSTGGVGNPQEVILGLSTELVGFDVGFNYYWDIEGDNDGYSELTIDRSYALCEAASLDLGATISYDWETSDVHHYGLSAAVNYALNDVLTITPYVSATFAEDGAQTGVLGFAANDDEVFGGVVLSAAF